MTQKPTAKSFGNTYLSGNTCPDKTANEDVSKRDVLDKDCPLNNSIQITSWLPYQKIRRWAEFIQA